ncbi:Deoxyuridine 5'-triphosphate nucleotidohydrolase [Wallemia ichthyophaga EXF-994]|uniref:Deoxyuridine 5'-triphosphate nucleotidohydrolase n=1 Tax=Wallemia ichthyophaga (strain EXF-994 / CBS 113033) TaxID=1299270 RepID=R9AQY6_WALI9|nr:Deoxyuridine 5'-triphosphate nucleotidohydrolase [Wallemia ichthyophaga EXF-994]EOR04627.1 Deoxyuridine 5'-triphosphate nucleotidohydrolase [Wallemia ichthyophaga EXF-994]
MTKRDIEATQPDGTTEKESKMTKATQVTSLLVKKLCPQAQLPARGSAYAAGYDLFSVEKKVIGAGDKALIDLGISISVPAGTYGRVAPRSGLAAKHHIHTGAGVIDADYRGRVFVLLFNLSQKDFEINQGDRVAQLILEKIETFPVEEVEELSETVRGAGGFGSTGGYGEDNAQEKAQG